MDLVETPPNIQPIGECLFSEVHNMDPCQQQPLCEVHKFTINRKTCLAKQGLEHHPNHMNAVDIFTVRRNRAGRCLWIILAILLSRSLAGFIEIEAAVTITSIRDQIVFGESVIGPLPFSLSNDGLSSTQLNITPASDNQSIISDKDLLVTGSGKKRALLISNVKRSGIPVKVSITAHGARGATAVTTFVATSFSGSTQ